jgi:hypothetical protein
MGDAAVQLICIHGIKPTEMVEIGGLSWQAASEGGHTIVCGRFLRLLAQRHLDACASDIKAFWSRSPEAPDGGGHDAGGFG